MFNKKTCGKCGKKIKADSNFCSNCGSQFNEMSNAEWGMLGQKDEVNDFAEFGDSMFGGVGGKMIGKMIAGTMKMLEKELQREMSSSKSQPVSNMHLFINGQRIDLSGSPQQFRKPKKQIKLAKLPQNVLRDFSNLPRSEPATEMKRFADRIVYALKMPGVKDILDVSIIPLEESIEIKAVSKSRSYFKILPLKLPIVNYVLEKGCLVLEFGVVG